MTAGQFHCVPQWRVRETGQERGGKEARQVRQESVLGCILYLAGVCTNASECVCERVGVCDNDRLSPHSDVEPEPALILIHYLYFPQLADCANRIQHMHSRHAAIKGDGACGVVSFTGQCLTLTAQNEPLHFNKNTAKYRDEKSPHGVMLHFNGCDKSYSVLQVSPKTLTFAVWLFFPKILPILCSLWKYYLSVYELLTTEMWKMHQHDSS